MAVDTRTQTVSVITPIAATTVANTNTGGHRRAFNIFGGTVTNVSVQDPKTGSFIQVASASPATIIVNPNQQWKMTYSVAPTVVGTTLAI